MAQRWPLHSLQPMENSGANKNGDTRRRTKRVSELEKESECRREELSSVPAQGGLAFTNPFLFDLFIQMKEQRQAGLCGTIALSPQTLTWSAFTRTLIIYN